jgi:multiple sugar transport system permease protein
MTLLPLALSLLVWLPVLFLLGGSIMGGAEIRELLLPALQEGVGGYAKWRLLPLYPTLAPYVGLLLDTPSFFVMYWNSVIITAGSLLGQCLIAVPAAWWFAGTRSRTGAGLFSLYTALMLMPFQVTMLPHYLVLDHMGLMDTHWGLVFPAAFSTFPVFIMYRFFRAIPPSMKEAAQIDGCGGFRLFISIGLPLGKPGVASAMILGFFEAWNLIEQPMTFLKTKSLWPLSLFLPEITKSTIGFSLAASVVTLLPSLLVFLIGQSYLEQGIIGSAVKE